MSDTPEATAQPPAPAPKSKLVPLLLIVNTAFGGAAVFLATRKPAPAEAKTAAEPAHEGGGEAKGHEPAGNQPGPILKMESFVIQLRTTDSDRYARVAFDIELATENDRGTVNARTSQLRDAIIAYFSDRTLDELRGSEGMERTKIALLKKFDELVPGRRIRGLFVTDFVIQ
jgi:flagellar FliL protein